MTAKEAKQQARPGQIWHRIDGSTASVQIETMDDNHVSYRQPSGAIHTKTWTAFVLRYTVSDI